MICDNDRENKVYRGHLVALELVDFLDHQEKMVYQVLKVWLVP